MPKDNHSGTPSIYSDVFKSQRNDSEESRVSEIVAIRLRNPRGSINSKGMLRKSRDVVII